MVEAVEGLNDQQLTHLPATTDNRAQGERNARAHPGNGKYVLAS